MTIKKMLVAVFALDYAWREHEVYFISFHFSVEIIVKF